MKEMFKVQSPERRGYIRKVKGVWYEDFEVAADKEDGIRLWSVCKFGLYAEVSRETPKHV